MNFALRRFFSNVPKGKHGKGGMAFLSPLEKRGIIGMSGTASFDLLQGICTNDIKKFQKEQDKVALSTAFLDANGRIFADVLLNKPQIYSDGKKVSKEDEIWIDCDKSQLEDLCKHIKKYVLRKKIDIEDLSDDLKLWSLITPYSFPEKTECGKIWHLSEETIDPEDEDNYGDFGYVDPRLPMLGIRMVTYAEGDRLAIEGQEIEQTKDQKSYDIIRTLYGVGEGSELISCLPFTANMDFLGNVSLNKGCYVGQELTARSYHTGVIRKRIMPFVISTPKVEIKETSIMNVTMRYHDDSYSKELKDKAIKNKKGQTVGKVLTQINNVGLAVVSVGKIQEDENFQGLLENDICSIMSLDWFKTDLDAYTTQLKARDPDLLAGGDE